MKEYPLFHLLAVILAIIGCSPESSADSPASNPYGDGRAAQRIRQAILHHFDLGAPPRDFKVA